MLTMIIDHNYSYETQHHLHAHRSIHTREVHRHSSYDDPVIQSVPPSMVQRFVPAHVPL